MHRPIKYISHPANAAVARVAYEVQVRSGIQVTAVQYLSGEWAVQVQYDWCSTGYRQHAMWHHHADTFEEVQKYITTLRTNRRRIKRNCSKWWGGHGWMSKPINPVG